MCRLDRWMDREGLNVCGPSKSSPADRGEEVLGEGLERVALGRKLGPEMGSGLLGGPSDVGLEARLSVEGEGPHLGHNFDGRALEGSAVWHLEADAR